jgi:nucleoside 2-deoxyribosyltransferase
MSKIVIYPAAALFNARETYFNSELVERLENLGYQTNFPQRDGFEFSNLRKTLEDKIPHNQIGSAVLDVIYFLDMGVYLMNSDVVLANLDEPLDEGVVVEISYARLMGKLVIGLRTDVRTPYGGPGDCFGGMHSFPVYQAHIIISHYMPCRTPAERESQMDVLTRKIHETILNEELIHQEDIPDYARSNPHLKQLIQGAQLLFHNIPDIHSSEGLEEIAARYVEHKKRLEETTPIK